MSKISHQTHEKFINFYKFSDFFNTSTRKSIKCLYIRIQISSTNTQKISLLGAKWDLRFREFSIFLFFIFLQHKLFYTLYMVLCILLWELRVQSTYFNQWICGFRHPTQCRYFLYTHIADNILYYTILYYTVLYSIRLYIVYC